MKFHIGYIAIIGGLLMMVGAFAAQRATSVPGYLVVTTCGTLPSGVTYTAGQYQPATIDTTGKRC